MQGNNGRDQDRERIAAYLRAHPLVGHDESLVQQAVSCTELIHLGLEDILIGTGREDCDLYLIFSGSVDVIMNGRVSMRLRSGETVGELEMISGDAKRVATVVACETTMVGRIPEPAFTRLADSFPFLWRSLARRLVQRVIAEAGKDPR